MKKVMMRTVNSRETSKLAFIGFIILVCLTSVSAESYIWNGENNAAWDSQVLAASNDLGENSDDLTHSDVCKWLEENNQEGLENNCATVPDLGWVEVSKIITEVQSSDLTDKWIKVSKIITCVEKKDTPVKAYSCESAGEIGKVVSLIKEESSQNSDGDEDNNDNTGQHEHTLGDIYFWDTESEKSLVNTEAGNNYEGQKVEYDMFDGEIKGRFTWDNHDKVEHTLWIRNEHNGESFQVTNDGRYVKAPPAGDGVTWGVDVLGSTYEMDDTGCTEFTAAVLPPDWDGEDSEVSYDAKQMNVFTLCPNNRGDDQSEDKVSETSGSYEFEVKPSPENINLDTDVTATVRGDLEGKRARLELNGIPGWNNDPQRYRECSGSPCSVTINSDRISGEPNSVDVFVKEEHYGQTTTWRTKESVSWEIK
jgi:hypothetical protein